MATPVTLTALTLPVNWCFSTYQDMHNTFVAATSASIAETLSTFQFQSSTPTDQSKPWFKRDANFNPDKWYSYSTQYSKWLALHPMPPGMVIMWTGAEADIPTLDGGDTLTNPVYSGPMWEKLATINGRVPIGPGTLDQGTVVAIGGTGGTEKVGLVGAELAPHTHDIKGRNLTEFVASNLTPDHIIIDDDYVTGTITKATESAGGTAGVVTPHQNMPPYLGIFFIKRTARIYYTGA